MMADYRQTKAQHEDTDMRTRHPDWSYCECEACEFVRKQDARMATHKDTCECTMCDEYRAATALANAPEVSEGTR